MSAGSPRALRALLGVCLLLVIHGTLYPWRFEWEPGWRDELIGMFTHAAWWTDFEDVLGNIVLFAPLGTLGQLVLRVRGWPAARAAWAVAIGGIALAFALQVAQIFIPERDAALSDVWWNSVGLIIGLGLALVGSHLAAGQPERAHQWRVPMAFVVLWLGLQWWPLAPTNWARIAMAVAELPGRWTIGSLLDALLSVAVLAHLLRPLQDERRPVLQAAVLMGLGGKLLFSAGSLSLSQILGLGLGLALAPLLWRWPVRRVAAGLLVAASAWFVADALRPLRWSAQATPFGWMPFEILLHGSMLANLLALIWNLFWTGVMVVLGGQLIGHALRVSLLVSLGVLLLEALQTHLPGRIADITNALLPWIWAIGLAAMIPAATPPSPPRP